VAAGWMRNEHARLPQASLSIHPIHAEASSTVPEATGTIQSLKQALRQERSTGVLFVDNLDSFSLNIADAFAQLGHNVTVLEGRSPSMESYVDPVALNDLLDRLQPTHIVLGPGPGRPNDGALTLALAHHALAGQLNVPVLGVCLGHQALAQADGWNILAAPEGPVHGVPVLVEHDGSGLFGGLGAEGMVLTRYNSLVTERTAKAALFTNATEKETGYVMGLHHPSLPIHGLQVHPESIGSPRGKMLLKTFLEIQSDG
jgi:anthranilate synthase/aminodeoxychorismate synthase-like glutamine amidotransferase